MSKRVEFFANCGHFQDFKKPRIANLRNTKPLIARIPCNLNLGLGNAQLRLIKSPPGLKKLQSMSPKANFTLTMSNIRALFSFRSFE